MMHKSKIEKRLPEPQPNSEQKADGLPSSPAIAKPNVSSSAIPKPTMEHYGYAAQEGFDGDEAGWQIEGGEDAYYEALKKWEDAQ